MDICNEIMYAEKTSYIEGLLREKADEVSPVSRSQCEPYLAGGSEAAAKLRGYVKALDTRREYEVLFENALAGNGCQAFLLPTMRTSAPLVPKNAVEDALAGKTDLLRDPSANQSREELRKRGPANLTSFFNLTHQPSCALPMGLDSAGMPASLMISGAKWDDATVLQIAHAFQEATAHHKKRPPALGTSPVSKL